MAVREAIALRDFRRASCCGKSASSPTDNCFVGIIRQGGLVECDRAHIRSRGGGVGNRPFMMEETPMTRQNQSRQTSKTELDLHELESVSGGCRKAGGEQ